MRSHGDRHGGRQMWGFMLSNGRINERIREKETTHILQTKVDRAVAARAINELHGGGSIDEIREGRVSLSLIHI